MCFIGAIELHARARRSAAARSWRHVVWAVPLLLGGALHARAQPATEAERLLERAKRYEYGVGAPQNLDRALELYCAASAHGSSEASYQVGWLYLTGRLGRRDEVLAAAWFQRSAGQFPPARAQLQRLDALDRPLDQPPDCVPRAALTARVLPPRAPLAAAPPARLAQPSPAPAATVRAVERRDIVALVQRLAPDYRLDPALVLAVIEAESNFDPNARSPKNAQGLMQLIPATAARFGVSDVWDPLANLRGGMAYLRWLLDRFNGDLALALAGYNAGEQAVLRHGGIPPYPETQGYVLRILRTLENQGGNRRG